MPVSSGILFIKTDNINMKKKFIYAACWLLSSWVGVKAQGQFVHPGLLHSEEDFETVKARIAANEPLALEALEALRTAPPVNGNWGGNWAINETVIRGVAGDNYMNLYRNAHRAYDCALLWKITGEEHYGDIAIDILNGYRKYNKALGGNTNISLIPGFNGYQLLNAAEIMRDYSKWSAEDIELFKQYMIDVWFTVAQDFLERRHDTVTREGNWYHYHSNWGQGNALFCISLGVFCDLPDIYNYGMYWLKEGPGNESLYVGAVHPLTNGLGLCGYGWGQLPWFHKDERGPLGYLCQTQESGRDQGHAMAALGLMSYGLQTAYNQGDNAFCNLNNSLVKGEAGSAMVAGAAEYVAMFNSMDNNIPEEAEIIASIPYKTNWWMGALNWTGQGQWRPIWQLFINHYQNRMGIPMQYSTKMKNKIGMERGGGSYGNNSGGYDHLGFGDLMHKNEPVTEDKVPTLLFPVITINGTTTRRYAEYMNIEPGTVVMLAANLPEGETDTGNWEWEDGVSGNNRQITVNTSGIYRLTYTNANGVKSTQLFCLSMRGEGIRGTLSATVTYNGINKGDVSTLEVGLGSTVSVTTGYSNWNYIESEKWYDENGNEIATGGTCTYKVEDTEDHKLVFKLTNQSGVVIERVFELKYNENDMTHTMPDPYCNDLTKWNCTLEGLVRTSAALTGLSGNYIKLQRPATENGLNCWGLDVFTVSQQMTGLAPGKYEIGANIVATQEGMSGAESKNYVKDVYFYAGHVHEAVSSVSTAAENFVVNVWVGEDGTLTYGVTNKTNQNRGYSFNGMSLMAMDNYSLIYLGEEALADDFEALRAEASDVEEGTIPAVFYEALQTALTTTDPSLSAIVTLQNALADARLVQVRHKDFMVVYNLITSYMEANSVADAVLAEAVKDFASAATVEEYYTAYECMEQAWNDYLPSAPVAVDVSSKLQNTELEASGEGVMYDNGTRWLTEADGGNYRVFAIDGSDANRGEAVGTNMIERYCTGNFFANQRLIYQMHSEMPIGKYVFEASAFKGAAAGAIELFANAATEPVLAVNKFRQYAVSAIVSDSLLAVGIKSAAGNACQWTGMADIAMTYYSPLYLLKEQLEEVSELTYGTDEGGVLAAAKAEATALVNEGTASERMAAYNALVQAADSYRLTNASVEHPYDMTSKVRNADFSAYNMTGWTVSDNLVPGYVEGTIEFYKQQFDISQKLTGLPAGDYKLTLQARCDKGAENKNFMLYATAGAISLSAEIKAQTRADGSDQTQHLQQNADDLNANPNESLTGVNVFVSDGTLTIGAKCTDNDSWCVLNGMTLEYLGMSEGGLVANWQEQLAAAKAFDMTTVPAAIAGQLEEAMTVNVSGMTTEELNSALAKLVVAYETAVNAVQPYADFCALKATCQEIAENSKPNTAFALTQFTKAIETNTATVEETLTVNPILTAYNTLETARQNYCKLSVPINGIAYDMTFCVINPSGQLSTGWANDGAGNFGPMNNPAQNGEYEGDIFFEKWDVKGYEFKDGARPIYQTIKSMPSGRYRLTAAAFRVNQEGAGEVPQNAVCLYFNDGRQEVTSTVLDYHTVEGYVSDKTAEFGLIGGAGNTANWVGIADVSLMYYGVDTVAVSENDMRLEVDEGKYACVAMHQSLCADYWNVVCLPFDLTSTQVRNLFSDVQELTAVQSTDGVVNLMFEHARVMTAGVPYLVKVADTVTEYIIDGVVFRTSTLSSGAVTVSDGTVSVAMKGVYGMTTVPTENSYLFRINTLTPANDGEMINAYRAYVEVEGATPDMLNIYIDGELTDVETVLVNEVVTVDVYTLDGVYVKHASNRNEAVHGLKPGIYVIGGQKVMVK